MVWIEEAAKRDGDLFLEQQAHFGGELVLACDPGLAVEGARARAASRPTGDAAKPATRSSNGCHSRAAKSTYTTGDGMGSTRGIPELWYGALTKGLERGWRPSATRDVLKATHYGASNLVR